MLAARYLTFIPFGLYRSVWRYAGARDAVAIASAVVVSEVIALAYMVLTQDMRDFSRDFFVVDALICMVAVGASRFAERAIVVGAQSVRDRTGRRSADRRRRPHRPQPDARAARDRRRARARLRRRQPAAAAAQDPRRPGARRDRRARRGCSSARSPTSCS